jgi:molybdate transport system substrate-binding protein
MAIKIAAAASLINGLPTAIDNFLIDNPDVEFDEVSYGSSGALARDIVAGTLPADVFISASEGAMDVAQNGGKVVSGTRFDFIANVLVIVKNNVVGGTYPVITSFADVNSGTANMDATDLWLPNPYEPDFVPAGIYAESAFKAVEHWGYVYGKALIGNTLAQDVQYTLNGVAGDTSPAIGVVYNSDAVGVGSANVTYVVSASNDINNTIIYPAARIVRSPQDAAVADFLTYLNNDSTRQIFIDNGFRALAPLAANR